jgi:hypothetical protein
MANISEAFLSRPPKLEADVGLRAEPLENNRLKLTVSHEGANAQIAVAPLAVPYPSGLKRLLAAQPDVEGVVVDRLRPGLYEAAQENEIAVLDLRGHGRIVAPGFVYVRPPSPDARKASPLSHSGRASPFAPKASRVVRILLSDSNDPKRLADIASEAGMNAGNAHRVLSSLLDMGLVERDHNDYVVKDAGSLLDAWADAASRPKKSVLIAAREGELDDLAREVIGSLRSRVAPSDDLYGKAKRRQASLAGRGAPHENAALSGELAAEMLAPHLSARSAIVHVWDPAVFERASRDWQQPLQPLVMSRIEIHLSDEGVGHMGANRDGLYLASPAQVYVDLHGHRGRARDAAEELRRHLLGY